MTTMPRPLRLLLVSARYFPSVGGTETHTREVATRLTTQGHEVTVLTTDSQGQLPADEWLEGVHVLRVASWPAGADYYVAPGIYRIIALGGWDIIHCQGYHTLIAPLTMFAAWHMRIPYIVTLHSGGHSSTSRNMLRGVQASLLRPLLARAVALVAMSRFEVKLFSKRLNLPNEHFIIIPSGSRLPHSPRSTSPLVADRTVIVSVGRLERYKGHQRIISALPEILKQCPNAYLRIVGTGPYESILRRKTHTLGIADRVEICGISASNRQGMASILSEAALVTLLSEYESLGLSILEALSFGCPVLVADVAALHDLVEDGLVRGIPLKSTPVEVANAVLNQLRRPLIPSTVALPSWEDCVARLLMVYRSSLYG